MSLENFDHFRPTDSLSQGHTRDTNTVTDVSGWSDDPTPSPEPRLRRLPRTLLAPLLQYRRHWVWYTLAAVALTLVLSAGGTLYYFDQSFAGLIYPNISIQGIAVGQMSRPDASDALRARYDDFLTQPLTLTYGDQTWNPSLADLGVQVEIDDTVEQAFAAGRRNGLFNSLQQVSAIWEHGLDLPLRISIDQETLQAYIIAQSAEIDRSTQDAELIVRGSQVATRLAVPGHQTLVNDTMHDVIAAIQSLESQTVVLRTRALAPQLDDAAVAEAEQVAQAFLQGPIILKADDNVWEWTQNDIAAMLRVYRSENPDGSGDQLDVRLDPLQLQQRLNTIAEETERPSINPRVNWNGGNLEIFREGEPGQKLDQPKAKELILAAAAGPNREIDLPFQVDQNAITADTIDQLSIPDLLGVGRSDFTGSAAYRITNIQAGMRLLHGILLSPGEEFSFNNNIGAINAANGFVEGYAIIQNRTQLEWGGGICQDSTTMFRAAFWAGLPITERHGHSFYINWYDKYGFGDYGNGPGMDATIFTGGPDLRFLNDTGHWVLVQTYVNTANTLAEVRIYGTDTGRTVDLQGPSITNRTPPPSAPVYVPNASRPPGVPRQTDTARGGMTITYTRIVNENGTEVDRETFVTRFKPWPNIFEVHPADLAVNDSPSDAQEQPTVESTAEPSEQAPVEAAPPPPVPEEAPPAPPAEAPAPVAPPGDVAPIAPPGDVAPVVP